MLDILKSLIAYNFTGLGVNFRALPFCLTLNVTRKCNLRCKTCNIWRSQGTVNELTLDEYEKIFSSFGGGSRG